MIDIYQPQTSFLHQQNARVKTVFTLVFIVCCNLSPTGAWPAFILFFTLIAAMILFSRLNLRRLLVRSLISVPFVLAAFPLLFTGPEPHQLWMTLGQIRLVISHPGLIRFCSIAIKSWVSLLAAILLTSTTRFEDLLSAFRKLGLPSLLVSLFSLMWRYLSIMVDESIALVKARDSRSAGRSGKGTLVWRAMVTGKMVGNLMLRSLERSERVYAAMSARGYSGNLVGRLEPPLKKRDALFLVSGIFLCLLILVLAMLSH